jgi:hypothetical protein
MAAKNGGDDELGFRRLGRGCSAAARVRVGDPRGCGGGLNRPGGRLGVWATHGEACARPARARSRTRARVRLGHDARLGMTRGPHLSAAACSGEERWAGGGGLGRLGCAMVLGCDGASELE